MRIVLCVFDRGWMRCVEVPAGPRAMLADKVRGKKKQKANANANANAPALVRLGHRRPAADRQDGVAVVVHDSPVEEERRQQLGKALLVLGAPPLQGGDVVEVVAVPLADRLHARRRALLQDRQHRGRPLLEVGDRHEAVGVARQRARVGVVDAPPLGPVLDQQDQLPEPRVDRGVDPQQRRVGDGEVVVERDVDLGAGGLPDKLDDRDARAGDGEDLAAQVGVLGEELLELLDKLACG